MAACSSLDPSVKSEAEGKEKKVAAGLVGAMVAKKAVEKGVTEVCFDRGGWKYHGRVKSLADAAREGGLVF